MLLRLCGLRQAKIGFFPRNIQLIYSSTRGRLKRFSNIPPFYTGLDNVAEEQGQTRLQQNGWEPWLDARNWKRARTNQVDDKNIVVGDLNATLDAHRTANRIRKCVVFTGETQSLGFRQLDLSGQKKSRIDEGKVRFRKISMPALVSDPHLKSGKDKAIGEYDGQLPLPNKSWALNKEPKSADEQSPWLTFVESSAICGVERLSTEITAYERYMRLRLGEVESSRDVQETVDLIATEALPAATVDLIGSYSNGLATANSDMDFRLSLPMYEKDPLQRGPSPGRPKARKATMKHLITLHTAFTASEAFEEATLVRAAIPIIRVTHARTKIVVDIQVSSTELPQQLYKETYLAEYPTLRPLYIVLRSALHIRGLGAVFQGGLGSYSILIMIVYALKTCPPSIDKTDVGGQLLYMLKFYGRASLSQKGFSLDPPSVFQKVGKSDSRAHVEGRTELVARGIQRIGKINENRPYLLCLQDPADPMNDLGRKSRSIQRVQRLFDWAYSHIMRHLDQKEADSIESAKAADKGLLFPLVGANYEDFESRRRDRDQGGLVLRKPAETRAVQRFGVKAWYLNAVRRQLAAASSNQPAAIEQHEKNSLLPRREGVQPCETG